MSNAKNCHTFETFYLHGARFIVTIGFMSKTANPLPYPMTDHRRNLYFQIIDNHARFHDIAWRLHYLADHFPPDLMDRALEYLVNNRFVGTEFLLWFEHVCQKSDLEMHRKLFAEATKLGPVPLIAGRNFIL